MEDYGQMGLKAIQGFLISLCLLVLSFPLLAEQHSLKPLVLSNQSIASAGLYAEYFEDKSRKLTLDFILNHANQSFNFSTREVLTFGRSSSAWWVRFNLINQADLPWYLLLDANLGEDLDIFLLPVESPDKTIHSDLFSHYAMALEDYP
ncbi:MAG TPA: 7TM-DISM domain-containing protein, partial [Thiolinea sp.]|nr:7TM-DISM domain-containing protein [Thiolinea sp.]